jgi:hypothetical protein
MLFYGYYISDFFNWIWSTPVVEPDVGVVESDDPKLEDCKEPTQPEAQDEVKEAYIASINDPDAEPSRKKEKKKLKK